MQAVGRSLPAQLEALGKEVVDAGFHVHQEFGPGLLESAYEQCLLQELRVRGLGVNSQVDMPLRYKGLALDCGYRLDLVVEDCLIVEVKAVETLARVHEAQMLTYLKLAGYRLGFLMNFNVALFKDGIRRFVS